MPKQKPLAVAYIDEDGDGKFHWNKDTVIAAVYDTNNDKVISLGDTLTFGEYPTHLDGLGAYGTFHPAGDYTIESVYLDTGYVQVGVLDPDTGYLSYTIFQNYPNYESFSTPGVALYDNHTSLGSDYIIATSVEDGAGFPAFPDTTVAYQPEPQPGDDPFLDVYIA
jgi:hypothetical protein